MPKKLEPGDKHDDEHNRGHGQRDFGGGTRRLETAGCGLLLRRFLSFSGTAGLPNSSVKRFTT